MDLRTPNNKLMISLLTTIATQVVKRLKQHDEFDTVLVEQNVKALAEAILIRLNKQRTNVLVNQLASTGGTLKWELVPGFNSILSQLSYTKQTSSMSEFNLSTVDSETINLIANKLVNEILQYKDITIPQIQRYSNKIKALSNSTDSEAPELFHLKPLSRMELFTNIIEKDTLHKVHTSQIELNTSIDISMYDPVGGEIDDLELSLLRDEELKTLPYKMDTLDLVHEILDAPSVIQFQSRINKCNLTDINSIILIYVTLYDKYKKDPNDVIIANLLNITLDMLNSLNTQYENMLNYDTIVYAVEKVGKSITIHIIKDNYEAVGENKIKLKAIYGSVLSKFKYDDINGLMFISITKGDFDLNSDTYLGLHKSFLANYILTFKNKNFERLTNYYIFGLDVALSEEEVNLYSNEVMSYISNLNLAELSNINNTTTKIFRDIIKKGTNFNIFMSGIDEAKQILGKGHDMKTYASYGALNLVLSYLYVQTDII